MSVLFIGPAEEAVLSDLRAKAEAAPINMQDVLQHLKTEEGAAKHMERMTQQQVIISRYFRVVYSIEQGHPCGECRHLSVSMEHGPETGRVPSPNAVWMIAEYFGFRGSLRDCVMWPEEFRHRGPAINLVQPTRLN